MATEKLDTELSGGAQLFDKYKDEFWAALEHRPLYDALIQRLPANVPEVVAAWWLTAEVENGGFNQYFDNSYGAMIDEAIRGLEMTGQAKFAASARSAKDEFGGEVPFDRDERMLQVEAICDKNDRCWGAAQAMYYSVTNDEWARYRDRADEFAKALLNR
ncbi:DUF4375 domain-containing protein [Mesorhizobium sp. YM1C-6-2]|uniref:DMP19 family protein n=1 Tax=Mesorhizobium sp. YM1C-6-2 TaxID=1827501 RepID=UPI000EF1ABEA|nr:DUF4375 domain-containing protein [Mesorhizobium sp. YM1C-6-2]RLP24834.1 DUF4375 domain-containing protein [Mesorhizobium sp. YM1C-6-2]